MVSLTARNLPEDVHRALRVRAAQHGRSTEAEIRAIWASAVKPQDRLRIGDAIFAAAHACGVTTEDVESLEPHRTIHAAEPIALE
jgi:plasmid stability protein